MVVRGAMDLAIKPGAMKMSRHYSKEQKTGKREPKVMRSKGRIKGNGNKGPGLPMMKRTGPMRVSV